MTPVIRIDDEVMDELKRRAVQLGLVFESPNATIRKVLGLDSKTAIQPEATPSGTSINEQKATAREYIVRGEIYKQYPTQRDSTWEIGHLKRPDRDGIPYDQYPYVKEIGTRIKLIIYSKEYPANFHHYAGNNGGGYIGRSTRDTPSIKDILTNHGLDKHKTPVTLRFIGDKVYLEPVNPVEAGR